MLPDLEKERESRWILNLSMQSRDRYEREKFYVTFAETPNRWRRVTVSCNYEDAPPNSLEEDLRDLRYQRDKSARIYEAIRNSLSAIQFYDTVTNLKLETRDGQLHVHVTEDVNEIIPYPPVSSVRHLRGSPETTTPIVAEDQLHFVAHLSGFVYQVRWQAQLYIKKEIPGIDTVEEFLYEINALHALRGSANVIRFEAIIVDAAGELVKGLLISFAEAGALGDLLYEHRGAIDWARRERWAHQIVHGLCEIHEAGYVQGDFTPSNIVIDRHDHAKIIDINRRGCPIGWEPPEIAAKIESHQRISMYIGVKTDLFQLGMTLWALATQDDEPDRQRRPLTLPASAAPDYFRRVVAICLSDDPRARLSAKELLACFPPAHPAHPVHPAHPAYPQRNVASASLDGQTLTHPVPTDAPDGHFLITDSEDLHLQAVDDEWPLHASSSPNGLQSILQLQEPQQPQGLPHDLVGVGDLHETSFLSSRLTAESFVKCRSLSSSSSSSAVSPTTDPSVSIAEQIGSLHDLPSLSPLTMAKSGSALDAALSLFDSTLPINPAHPS